MEKQNMNSGCSSTFTLDGNADGLIAAMEKATKAVKGNLGSAMLLITFTYCESQDEERGNILRRNLHDFAVSLYINLRRRHNAGLTTTTVPGLMQITVFGADQATVESYVTAFHRSMTRQRQHLLVTYAAC